MSVARPRVAVLALVLSAAGPACSGTPPPITPVVRIASDPAEAEVVTSDVAHFWDAYDAGAYPGAFEGEYLALASPGLTEFRGLRTITAADLAAMVARAPRYFAAIRDRSRGLDQSGVPDTIRAAHRKMKEVYPAAVFPPVTLVVGRFATMGTASMDGVFVGAEFFGLDGSTPLDELQGFQLRNVHPLQDLPVIVEHELVHVLQARARRSAPSQVNLLYQAVLEGSADFIGELASGGNVNRWMFDYALQDESTLWAEFSAEMYATDVSRWLYNQGASTGGRPGDLGYFFGYRIAQAYYARAVDKVAAVAEIIALQDAAGILRESGYGP